MLKELFLEKNWSRYYKVKLLIKYNYGEFKKKNYRSKHYQLIVKLFMII